MKPVEIPREALMEDLPAAVLAERLGCSESTVLLRRREEGIARSRHREQTYPITMEDIRTMTRAAVAQKYGCSITLVDKRRRKLGITDHPKAQRPPGGGHEAAHLDTRTPREKAVFAAFYHLAEKAVAAGATVGEAIEAFHRESHQIMAHVTYFGDTVRIRGRASWVM